MKKRAKSLILGFVIVILVNLLGFGLNISVFVFQSNRTRW